MSRLFDAYRAVHKQTFMPIFVAVIAAVFLRERLSRPQKLGLCLITAAALLIVGWPDADRSTARAWGHALFLSRPPCSGPASR